MTLRWVLGPNERQLLIDSVVTVILAITGENEIEYDEDDGESPTVR